MTLIADLLTRFPNCRVTIGSGRTCPKPREGDLRFFKTKGGWHMRKQVRSRDGYHVRNGRPVFEWVAERHWDECDRLLLKGRALQEGK